MPALTQDQLDHFATEGYVVAKGAIDSVKTLDPVIEEYAAVLDLSPRKTPSDRKYVPGCREMSGIWLLKTAGVTYYRTGHLSYEGSQGRISAELSAAEYFPETIQSSASRYAATRS